MLFRNQPDYYEVVSHPIDMMKIQQKLRTEDYQDAEQFSEDFKLLISNAKAYYLVTLTKLGSVIFLFFSINHNLDCDFVFGK